MSHTPGQGGPQGPDGGGTPDGTGTSTDGALRGAAADGAPRGAAGHDAAGDAVLVVDDVHLAFAGIRALQAVSFTVRARELFAVIGPNGAGKTSIFNVLSGVYRPQRGRVRFHGRDIVGLRPHVIAGLGMARTFQNIALFENLSVIDNLMLGRHQHSAYGVVSALLWSGRARREEVRNRAVVERIVEFLDLQEHRRTPVGLLPYGIQKRVELGRALAMEPRLLLLDEPAAGMNLEETRATARVLLDVRDELGVPMILVEHDMGLVMDLADRVLVLDFGQPITVGPPAQVQRHPDVIRAYLGQEHATAATAAEGTDASGADPGGEGAGGTAVDEPGTAATPAPARPPQREGRP